MAKFFDSKKEITESLPERKRSIMLRWAFANTIFCFITFTIFAVLVYQLTITTFINSEKDDMMRALDNVEQSLSQAEMPLSEKNLSNYLAYARDYTTSNQARENELETLGSMIGSRKSFYVFDVSENLLYSTNAYGFPLRKDVGDSTDAVRTFGDYSGYLVERPVHSQKTGKLVGYVQAFYDMSYYYTVRTKLLIALIILEIIALFIAQFVGYFMASRYIKPLERLHDAIITRTNNLSMDFKPVVIQTGDEIEELATVYNDMMTKINEYVDQQKRFVSDVSHELRTPLAVLDGHLNLLNRWGKNDPEVLDESLLASIEEVKTMRTMLEEMLALARLESIDFRDEDLICDPIEVSNFLMKNFLLIHPDLDLTVKNDLTPGRLAHIYPNHYEQGLKILIDNAIKYSPADRQEVSIHLEEDENFIITSVEDHGYGIGKDDLKHIFERFFRADKARNRDIGGTGLGLSIISRLVKNYEGDISVTSVLGEGSKFILKIPKIK
ncbi:HAMP domain-containing sensor histidine kinase [Lactococcus garvieae]|uniref:HAMP domain-containing sensor histidine kinase n=1 Tax=Lactococcus garvieae TaxID=1363 RepID=UPI0009BD5817|nr:HAMP domain-containing sensor histidine kinase [Lactococcus garvieae]